MEKDKDQLPLPISHELLKNIAQMKEVVLLSTEDEIAWPEQAFT